MNMHLLLLLVTLTQFLVGTFLLWRGCSLTSDKAWSEHVERCAAQGLHPERNAYWERSVRRGRVICIIVGVSFLIMGAVSLSMFGFSPFSTGLWP